MPVSLPMTAIVSSSMSTGSGPPSGACAPLPPNVTWTASRQLVLEALGHLLRKEQLVTGIKIDAETYAVELTGLRRAAAVLQGAVRRRAAAAGGGAAVGTCACRREATCQS